MCGVGWLHGVIVGEEKSCGYDEGQRRQVRSWVTV